MDLAIVHYHLNRGGVTQVIGNHLRALAAALAAAPSSSGVRAVVVHGGRRDGWDDRLAHEAPGIEVRLAAADGLDYDEAEAPRPDALAGELRRVFAAEGLAPERTVVHVHNHALGKNVSLPGAIRRLAGEGWRLLLQPHDFAEDFRPENYRRLRTVLAGGDSQRLAAELYPQAAHLHYAVLNRRDFAVLQRAGAAAARLHLLPNPIVAPCAPAPADMAAPARTRVIEAGGLSRNAPLVLYPVRGIRRKNLGEALLWSAALGGEAQIATTLPPQNPVEVPRYEFWRQQAAQHALPMHFGLGMHRELAFADLLAAADLLLTTSVAEGFGMVFGECWLAGRMLAGRDLPEITGDFRENGLQFPLLAAQVRMPVEWIGLGPLTDTLWESLLAVFRTYQQQPPDRRAFLQVVEASFEDGTVDFARLSATLQAHTIAGIVGERVRSRRLRDLNPVLDRSAAFLQTDRHEAEEIIRKNAAAVERTYSLAAIGQRLAEIYRRLLNEPSGGAIGALPAADRILESFLDPLQLLPIRTDP